MSNQEARRIETGVNTVLLDSVCREEERQLKLGSDEEGPTEEEIKSLSGTGRWEQLQKTRYIPWTEQLETKRDGPLLPRLFCCLGDSWDFSRCTHKKTCPPGCHHRRIGGAMMTTSRRAVNTSGLDKGSEWAIASSDLRRQERKVMHHCSQPRNSNDVQNL